MKEEAGLTWQGVSGGKTGGLMCTYCGESGHFKKICYEIIGYPDWWDLKKNRKNIGKNMGNCMNVEHK